MSRPAAAVAGEFAPGGPVRVGGTPLTIQDVLDVAVGAPAELDPVARAAMRRARTVTRRALAAGASVYGLTTGVGALKRHAIGAQHNYNRMLILDHCVGHGPPAPAEFVRAAMVVRAHGLALGGAGVRPQVVESLLAALNAGVVPDVHLLGSIGQGDLSPLAEIARALMGESPGGDRMGAVGLSSIKFAPGEGLAFMSSNAFSIGIAALGVARASTALHALERSAALSFEAFAANISAIDPVVAQVRPHDGLRLAIERLRAELAGGALLSGGRPPRSIQDPLCFRVTPQTLATAHHALIEARQTVETELGSRSENPVVLPDRDGILTNGNFDSSPLTVALDYARLGLAQAAKIANERILKLLDPRFSGLAAGLRDNPASAGDGIGVAGHGATALAAEIRLLAAPVSLEQPTSALAEGIEDMVSLAPIAARRLHEMAGHMIRLAAVELMCAAQAVDLRGDSPELGDGTAAAYRAVRDSIQFRTSDSPPNGDLAPLTEWLTRA
jgi:histidine ammonia-lyase